MSSYSFRNENLGNLFDEYAKINISSCICCGSSDFCDWGSSGPYKAFKCNKCGLIFMNPQLNEDGLNDYYSNYIGKRRLNNKKKMELRNEQYILDTDLILPYITKGDKILDVGCNGGFFLNTFGHKYDRWGTELDKSAVKYAKKVFPEFSKNIHYGTLHQANFKDETFDLVMMRGVIEHVLNPNDTIKEISRILNQKGRFYICATPNGESYAAELYRQNWTLFHPVQHLWHFSARNLSMICKKFNLRLIWKDYPYLGTPYENVKSDINFISKYIQKKDDSLSPPFFESMMSLIFEKL